MTIKEYLKTLKEKDIIVIEPDLFAARGGESSRYVNSVRHLLKLDPPILEYEYNGCSSVEAINGMKGKLIIYKTNTPQVSPIKPVHYDYFTIDDTVTVSNYLSF